MAVVILESELYSDAGSKVYFQMKRKKKNEHCIFFFTYFFVYISLVDITEEGIKTLNRLNVIAAFDFRSDPEIERQGVMP